MVERETITSKDNRRIKDLRKLHTRKHRKKTGRFLIEGEHLIEEAVRHSQEVHLVILEEGYDAGNLPLSGYETVIVSAPVMKSLSSLETPPGVMASVSYRADDAPGERVLLLDGLQDPGNVGTLIRTADAFGFDTVICSPDTVDPFSDKVLRSSQGSTFHVSIKALDPIRALEDFNGAVYGTALEGAVSLEEASADGPVMIVLGNEGRGVSDEMLQKVDGKLRIRMPGGSESLNVAVAGGIIMHHFKA